MYLCIHIPLSHIFVFVSLCNVFWFFVCICMPDMLYVLFFLSLSFVCILVGRSLGHFCENYRGSNEGTSPQVPRCEWNLGPGDSVHNCMGHCDWSCTWSSGYQNLNCNIKKHTKTHIYIYIYEMNMNKTYTYNKGEHVRACTHIYITTRIQIYVKQLNKYDKRRNRYRTFCVLFPWCMCVCVCVCC
jgi:hypothetical protein